MALGGTGWTLENYLTASIWQAFTGQPHPAMPESSKAEDPIRLKKFEEARARMKEREEKLASGEIPT